VTVSSPLTARLVPYTDPLVLPLLADRVGEHAFRKELG
jgi:hypothetical protein